MATTDEIKLALKGRIKELERELGGAQRALAALEVAPLNKAKPASNGNTKAAAASLADTVNIDAVLKALDGTPRSLDTLAEATKLSKGKVRAALKALVAKKDAVITKSGRTSLFTIPAVD